MGQGKEESGTDVWDRVIGRWWVRREGAGWGIYNVDER